MQMPCIFMQSCKTCLPDILFGITWRTVVTQRVTQKFGYLAFEWLEFVAGQKGITIKHMFNGGEKTTGSRGLKVDGFCRETSLIFEFHGCIWRGCTCGVNRDAAEVLNKVNLFGKDIEQLREDTKKRTQHLHSLGYDVKEMWECEWKRMKKDRDVKFLQDH